MGGHGAHALLQQRLILWVRWLLGDLVVPLLRAHFYCTESEAYRQEVFYYRCPLCLKPHISIPSTSTDVIKGWFTELRAPLFPAAATMRG